MHTTAITEINKPSREYHKTNIFSRHKINIYTEDTAIYRMKIGNIPWQFKPKWQDCSLSLFFFCSQVLPKNL